MFTAIVIQRVPFLLLGHGGAGHHQRVRDGVGLHPGASAQPRRGVTSAAASAFLLSAPAINPIVLVVSDVVGPMVDLKLIALQSGTFGRAFSLGAVSAARDGFPFKCPRTDGDQSHDGTRAMATATATRTGHGVSPRPRTPITTW
ncbi:hypothetical protein SSPO_091690 [Streptomyces antimycoticus]|uniref:Uncharacterized protein n=1 Tax=Streptomyces antimycoticus TaxID=68175 RepID=A0A499VAA5_9ACTN|nr:hypothetical protein [Streptomyces antimycoticus]BBJ46451.1 hypothetical protein SSPO_091690 [Streptomyces antimycoticus]